MLLRFRSNHGADDAVARLEQKVEDRERREALRGVPLAASWLLLVILLVCNPAAAQETTAPLAPAPGEASASPLAHAAMQRDMQTVRALLAEGSEDVNAFGRDGTPALHWVVRVGDLDTARLLLAAGADVNLRNRYGLAPLHVAVTGADVELAQWLLEAGADASMPDPTGEAPLFAAARIGGLALVHALLEHGADVNARDPHFGQSALMVAAREGHADVVLRLIEAGAGLDGQTAAGEEPAWRLPAENAGSRGEGIIRSGWPERGMRPPVGGAKTALLYAVRNGHLHAVQALVEAGADLEIADANGTTPLIHAVINHSIAGRTNDSEHLAIAETLIEAGADVNAQDWYGQTPLWAAVDIRNLKLTGPNRPNGVDREAAFALIEQLLAAGADPNLRTREFPPERRFLTGLGSLSWVDMTGQTPFVRAAQAGDVRVMRLLLDHGADPNLTTNEGTTALMAAAGVDWVVAETFDEGAEALLEAVKLAHELGNDVDAVNSMGVRAIHGAANRGANDIIEYLVEHGARLDVADNQGRTPINWAEGVFLATHPPERKPETIALLERLQQRVALQPSGVSHK